MHSVNSVSFNRSMYCVIMRDFAIIYMDKGLQ